MDDESPAVVDGIAPLTLGLRVSLLGDLVRIWIGEVGTWRTFLMTVVIVVGVPKGEL